MSDIKIAVLVPSHGEWKAGFGHALSNMVANFCNAKYEGGNKSIEVVNVNGSILPDVRHRLVAEAFKMDATHALWLDADMTFPRDTLQCLLRHNVPVVGVNYPRRQRPVIPTAHLGNENGGILYTEPGDNGLVEVKHLGGGVKLVDLRVYDGFRGEDVYFCEKVKAAGIPIFCDQELSQHIGHIGEYIYTQADALAAREEARLRPAAE